MRTSKPSAVNPGERYGRERGRSAQQVDITYLEQEHGSRDDPEVRSYRGVLEIPARQETLDHGLQETTGSVDHLFDVPLITAVETGQRRERHVGASPTTTTTTTTTTAAANATTSRLLRRAAVWSDTARGRRVELLLILRRCAVGVRPSGVGATLDDGLQGERIDVHPNVLVLDVQDMSHVDGNWRTLLASRHGKIESHALGW